MSKKGLYVKARESLVEQIVNDDGKFVKADEGKTEWSLIPFEQLEYAARVLMEGAKKYSVDNWKKCDDLKHYKDALMRHIVSYINGEKIDSKANDGDDLPHLAHAICNCLFLMWFDDNKHSLDDDELDK